MAWPRLAALALAVAAAPTGAGQLQPLRLQLQWDHQAQFAGYYVALHRGIYARHGLDVTLLRGGADRDPLQALTRGDADAATFFLTAALVFADRGIPLRHLAQVVGRSHATLVAWRGDGVAGVDDLSGKKVTVWGDQFAAPYLALFRQRGVEPVILPQHYTVELFLRHGATACCAMEYNELDLIFQSGVEPDEVVVTRLRDLGVGPPEDGLYTLAPTLAARGDALRRLAEATLEGWQAAAADPAAALELVMRMVTETHVPTNRPHQRWMLETILPSVVPRPPDRRQLGELPVAELERTVELLRATGQIRSPVDPAVFPTLARHAP